MEPQDRVSHASLHPVNTLIRTPFAGQRLVKGERLAWLTDSHGGTLHLGREKPRPKDQVERGHAMSFHPDLILTLSELQNQERLRDAVKDRLAASGEAGAYARSTVVGAARLAAISWSIGLLRHVRGVKRVHGTAPLSRSAAPSVH